MKEEDVMNSKVVWKFEFPECNHGYAENHFVKEMPEGYEIVHVGIQGWTVKVWALVDPQADSIRQTFVVVGTGHPVPAGARHIATFFTHGEQYVGHLFSL
jgi:hypothetical protein